jgi:hypothetical protein
MRAVGRELLAGLSYGPRMKDGDSDARVWLYAALLLVVVLAVGFAVRLAGEAAWPLYVVAIPVLGYVFWANRPTR